MSTSFPPTQKWRRHEPATAARPGDEKSDPIPSQSNAHAVVINFCVRRLFSTDGTYFLRKRLLPTPETHGETGSVHPKQSQKAMVKC